MGTVDFGRFHKALRYGLEEGPHHDQIKSTDRTRQEQRPTCIIQSELTHIEVSRNQTAAEEHREHDKSHNQAAPLQISSG
ncbi:hypothetical protein D3C81_1707290 [compost metagenome]